MIRLILCGGLVAIAAVAPGGLAQQLLFTTAGDATAGPAPDGVYADNEVAAFSAAAGLMHRLTSQHLDALVGDVDGNGVYDDAPGAIDALCPTPPSVANDVPGFLVSFSRNTSFSGVSVLDGDIVSVQPAAGVLVVHSESTFATVTGTSTVDVDAFEILADGSLVFSFANDEMTSLPSLVQQNAGDPLLDETTVFVLPPGVSEASILMTKSDVVGYVNAALGTSVTTVVDTTGITSDPENPGHLMFCVGSSNSAIEGHVFTTAAGGQIAALGGVPLDSASFGFSEEEVLEGLATIGAGEPLPFVLHHPSLVPGPPNLATMLVAGATPGGTVALVAALTTFPLPHTTFFSQLGPRGYVYLNLADPLVGITATAPDFRTIADGNGAATLLFDVTFVPPGLALTVQAFDVAGLRVTLPISAVR